MKWYFAINQKATSSHLGLLAKLAVRTALRNTDLKPHLLYHGERNLFTWWMQRQGVTVIDARPACLDALHRAADAGWYPRAWSGHWLRMEVCNIEADDEFVLYTDVDVAFPRPIDLSPVRPALFACAPQFQVNDWSYFNGGAMVMNIPALRADYDRVHAHVMGRFGQPDGKPFHDQEIYNDLYRGRWDRLDPRYNWKPYWEPDPSVAIWHMHGPKLDDIRAMIDGNWDWNNAHQRVLGRLLVDHVRQYRANLAALRALMTEDLDLQDLADGILHDLPAALPDLLARAGVEAVRAERIIAIAAGARPKPVEATGAWAPQGAGAWTRVDGRAMVVRDGSRPGLRWLAALRNEAARLIDPDFLLDQAGRIRAFPTHTDARQACEMILKDRAPA